MTTEISMKILKQPEGIKKKLKTKIIQRQTFSKKFFFLIKGLVNVTLSIINY